MTSSTRAKIYVSRKPKKAKLIKKAVNKGFQQYEETFKRLAAA